MECNDSHARDETIGPREQMNGSLETLGPTPGEENFEESISYLKKLDATSVKRILDRA